MSIESVRKGQVGGAFGLSFTVEVYTSYMCKVLSVKLTTLQIRKPIELIFQLSFTLNSMSIGSRLIG